MNFPSRLTHSRPGRVVWVVFNVRIALLLMEFGIYESRESTLGLYAPGAGAWVGTIVADLTINKPLGLSPRDIEFRRAHLYDINPLGFGSMLIASGVAIEASLDTFGELPAALSSCISLGTAFIAAVLIPVYWQTVREVAPRDVLTASAMLKTFLGFLLISGDVSWLFMLSTNADASRRRNPCARPAS